MFVHEIGIGAERQISQTVGQFLRLLHPVGFQSHRGIFESRLEIGSRVVGTACRSRQNKPDNNEHAINIS